MRSEFKVLGCAVETVAALAANGFLLIAAIMPEYQKPEIIVPALIVNFILVGPRLLKNKNR